jgi:hypothetical protein
MATGILLGSGDQTDAGGLGNNYICVDKWQCSTGGSLTEIRIKCGGSGHVKVALYAADASGGLPGTRLAAQNTSQAVVAGWNTIPVPAYTVVKDAWYWLACNSDTSSNVKYASDTGRIHKYAALAFASDLPDPAPSSWNDYSNYGDEIAGWGIQALSPSGISQPVSYGSPKLILILKPPGVAQVVAIGAPAVVTSSLLIYPTGIAQTLSVGTPALRYPQVISPTGIIQSVAVGQPRVGIFGFVKPSGVAQQISIGSPWLYKYVWHVILDGQYATDTPLINRAYIIGKNQYGNPVYGTAGETSEVDLVGERLDFQQEIAIPTESQAGSMAGAILSKMRLTRARGVILIPPNCGQELFDVVQISDFGANQSAVKFRVVGIRFEYNISRARYEQVLILGAP